MIFLAVILFVISLIMVGKPTIIWRITESFKSNGTEPSTLYLIETRVGGIIIAVISVTYIITRIL